VSADLAAANKRISNLLKKQDSVISADVNEAIFSEDAESTLFAAITNIEAECITLFDSGDYQKGLEKLAALRTPVDDFFDRVMVMSNDQAEKQNRLALLKRMQSLFLRVADIALLQA